ncbi:MAG TPA: hypothetical protein IAC50_01935 [Candidatus Copromorpha excrementigallinarum]|uniref:Uncharacterized protein n=1 Tax=Candidatus Allocopromorpha excrementigallinarum TaxID=2840742 RepID=A0A9D1HZ25_9FIRM|nr:hypothetical protein [Candidatus Copromorpha excrementigallinarum]
MILLILALVFGLVVFVLLVRSIAKNTKKNLRYGNKFSKICEILKILICIETAAFIAIFVIVLIKTLAA